MNVELKVIDWHRIRKQQRRWQLRNHANFLRRWLSCTRELVL